MKVMLSAISIPMGVMLSPETLVLLGNSAGYNGGLFYLTVALAAAVSVLSAYSIFHPGQGSPERNEAALLAGVAGLELSRADFFEKELTFQVSCSYGPGRYDPTYEERGQDYPVGFVRWTEQRNFEAVLDMMADGRLDVRPLSTHRFDFEKAVEAYDLLGSDEHSLGIVLEYPGGDAVDKTC